MSVYPSHPPPDPDQFRNFEELLIAHLAEAHDTQRELVDRLELIQKPAQIETVVLTPQQPIVESRERWEDPVLSVGLYNPTSIVVYFNPIGSATPTARAYPVGANNLLVLPISTSGPIEVGCDATQLGGNNAVVFLMRFFTVQPAFLNRAF